MVGGRVETSGPSLRISGGAAQTLGMAVHELTANALKYGALSGPDGRVTLAWECDGQQFAMRWREIGGPPPADGGRSGFGKLVLGRMTKMALNGEVDLTFAPEGARWDLRCPFDKIEAKPFALK
jgi:two-component sensor histidine kinase